MFVSHHGSSRMQQRSIPLSIVDLLEECGSVIRCRGAEKLFFDKKARHRLSAKFGTGVTIKSIQRYLNVYAVVGDDGVLITAGRRTRRFKRDL